MITISNNYFKITTIDQYGIDIVGTEIYATQDVADKITAGNLWMRAVHVNDLKHVYETMEEYASDKIEIIKSKALSKLTAEEISALGLSIVKDNKDKIDQSPLSQIPVAVQVTIHKDSSDIGLPGCVPLEQAQAAYLYAVDVLKGPFPKGEDAISKNAEYAYLYVGNVLEQPWPKGEDAISKNTQYSYLYAFNVLKKPFPRGEDAISKDVIYAYYYALNVLKKPFPEGEVVISKDAHYSYLYAKDILKAPFPKGEDAIFSDDYISRLYKIYVLNKLEGEHFTTQHDVNMFAKM